MKRRPFLFFVSTVLASILIITGCDSTGLSQEGEPGTLEVRMTDASANKTLSKSNHDSATPGAEIEEALVTISHVSVVPAADTSEGDSTNTGVSVLQDASFQVDLADLQAGLDTSLVTEEIAPGTYSQIRLVTAGDAAVTFADGMERSVRIASGQQTGLKINFTPFTIDSADDNVAVTLNWNVGQSIHGNPNGQFVITPVIGATVETTAATDTSSTSN